MRAKVILGVLLFLLMGLGLATNALRPVPPGAFTDSIAAKKH